MVFFKVISVFFMFSANIVVFLIPVLMKEEADNTLLHSDGSALPPSLSPEGGVLNANFHVILKGG